MDDLLQEFIAETRERLESLSGEIVAWEAAPGNRARLDAIFRFVHTVKGSCGFLDLPRLGRLSHAAEDALAQVREGTRAADRRLVNAVLAVVDRIGEIVEAIAAGSGLDDSGEDLLIAALAGGEDAEGSEDAPAPVAVAPGGQRAPQRSIRLNVDLLDRMMSGMSDMVLARNDLARRLRGACDDPQVEAALDRLSQTVADMRDVVTRTRMQKIEALFSALPRMVRDTAATLGKSVTLTVEGSDVELDREMIEVMRDPLVHMVRNAIDHGIESPAERLAAGKRPEGRLTIVARQSGNRIIIEVIDDGRGVDVERLIAKLVRAGNDERALRALSPREKLNLTFEPGLSARDEVTEVSGRGVGMDVVRNAIEQIGGSVELDNAPGQGLRMVVQVPLTLSIIPAIVLGTGGQRFAVTRSVIEEILPENSDAVRIDRIGGREVATVRGRRMPLVDLGDVMAIDDREGDDGRMLVIVNVCAGSYALAVETLFDNDELVVKPAAPAVMAAGIYAGQTLPDNGMPMLLLDTVGIGRVAGLDFSRPRAEPEETIEEARAPGIPVLLFRDLDGARRMVPLEVVDRVEQVDCAAIRHTAGRKRIAVDGDLLPLAVQGRCPTEGVADVLRLRDGEEEVCYAIGAALDIFELTEPVLPAARPGPAAGVTLYEGEQIELLDAHWVFSEHLDAGRAARAPLALLSGDGDGWMHLFLSPLLISAGFRVATGPVEGETPAILLVCGDDPLPATQGAPAPVPVVRLRRNRMAESANDDSIYRYDRPGLLAALAARIPGER